MDYPGIRVNFGLCRRFAVLFGFLGFMFSCVGDQASCLLYIHCWVNLGSLNKTGFMHTLTSQMWFYFLGKRKHLAH